MRILLVILAMSFISSTALAETITYTCSYTDGVLLDQDQDHEKFEVSKFEVSKNNPTHVIMRDTETNKSYIMAENHDDTTSAIEAQVTELTYGITFRTSSKGEVLQDTQNTITITKDLNVIAFGTSLSDIGGIFIQSYQYYGTCKTS